MDGICLTVSDLAPFLTTKARMDQNKRALEFLYDQIAMNPVHFDPDRAAERSAELWGEMDEQYIYIIKPLFDRLLGDNGFNASSFLGWARQNGFIRIGKDGKSTITHRIRGKVARCVCLSLPVAEIEESSMEDVLPL